MKSIYIIKIVSVILIFIMMLSVIPNISLATNTQTSSADWGGIVSNLLKKVLNVIMKIFESFMPGTRDSSGNDEKSFYQVAEECKDVIDKNNFIYDDNTYGNGGDWGKVNFSNGDDKGNPASSERYSKEIDCSGYVSWVLFKYGSTSGSSLYKTLFNTQKGTKHMQIILPLNSLLFKKIGTLGECDSSLQKGDILLKEGHVEIYSYKSGGTYYCYDAGTTTAIQGGISTKGQCNKDTSEYTVYRVIQ